MDSWSVTSTLYNGFKYCASLATSSVSTGNSESEDSLEPLSLMISLAVAFLLPIKSKPKYFNHQITWDLPAPVSLISGTTLDLQGLDRSIKKRVSYEKTDHLLIIKLWPDTIDIALKLHRPKPSTENPRRIFLINFFFNEGKKGLDIKIKPTYAHLTDGTVDKLEACSRAVENDNKITLQLEQIEKERIKKEFEQAEKERIKKEFEQAEKERIKKETEEKETIKKNESEQLGQESVKKNELTQGSKEPISTNTNKSTKVLQENKIKAVQLSYKEKGEKTVEKKDSTGKTKDVEKKALQNPTKEVEKKEGIENTESAEKSKEEEIKPEEASTKEEDVPLPIKVKNIWEKMCFLETVYELYMEASSIPENERATNPHFLSCIDGIYSITGHHSGIYGLILKKHNKIVL